MRRGAKAVRWWAFALCVCLAACGRPDPSREIGPSEIGDRDPVIFNGRGPETYPIKGTDVSRFQTSVDWPRAGAAGISFAFIKATEGGDLLDPMFREHWLGAGRAGIRRGAYHFYYFCTPPEVQERWFIRHVPRTRGSLPPVLDVEWNPRSPTCNRRPDGARIRDEMRRFLRIVTAHYRQRPIVYTTPGFYEDAQLNRLRGYEFWLRSTAKTPREVYPGQAWSFWQYSATGILPGTPGNIDLNVFNGSRAAWEAWLDLRTRRR